MLSGYTAVSDLDVYQISLVGLRFYDFSFDPRTDPVRGSIPDHLLFANRSRGLPDLV